MGKRRQEPSLRLFHFLTMPRICALFDSSEAKFLTPLRGLLGGHAQGLRDSGVSKILEN
jgi:hypothetical protein